MIQVCKTPRVLVCLGLAPGFVMPLAETCENMRVELLKVKRLFVLFVCARSTIPCNSFRTTTGSFDACGGELRPAVVALSPPPSRTGRRYPRKMQTRQPSVSLCDILCCWLAVVDRSKRGERCPSTFARHPEDTRRVKYIKPGDSSLW